MSPVLTTLDARARRRLHAALRVGVAMDLHLDEPLPTDLVPAEVGPLFRHVEAADRALQASLRRWQSPRAQRVPGPAVTAILPACRGRPIGIPALRGQDLPVRVLVLSNGPNGPRRCPGAVVTRVPWTGHGPTRQGVLANVESPYVLLTVDDAVLLGAGCLRRMVQVLESGPWDAVVARQIPWPDADPVTRRRLRQWTPPSDGPQRLAQTDHVCTLYRTETLRKHPLPAVPIAEDLAWSLGRRVALAPGAPVLHAHRRHARALFHREREIHAQRRILGLPTTVPHLGGAMLGAIGAVRAGPREVVRHAAEATGQWWGGRAG